MRDRSEILAEIKQAEEDLAVAQVQVVGIGGDADTFKPGPVRGVAYGFIGLGAALALAMIQDGSTGMTLIVFGLGLGVVVSGSGVALLLWVRAKQRTFGGIQARCRTRIIQLQAELQRLEPGPNRC